MSLTPFRLSDDQIKAIEGISNIFTSGAMNTHKLAVLTGSAGTGKTFTANEIINKLNKFKIVATASTHRAAGVLSDSIGIKAITAHKAFALKPVVTRNGNEILKPVGRCDIPTGAVVIIDEASMIGNTFLKAITKIVKDKWLKVLFIGDPYQLPPTADVCSLFDGSLPTFTLTKVHRQIGDNPILDKAVEYREYIEGTRDKEPTITTQLNASGEGIHLLAHSEFTKEFVKKYVDYTAGTLVDIPLCTYTNDSAINYNDMIRKATYFLEDTIQPFYKGELMISNSSTVLPGINPRILLNNNEQVIIENFSEIEHDGIPGYSIQVRRIDLNFEDNLSTVFVPLNKAVVKKRLDELKEEAIHSREWTKYYDLKNFIADIRPPFAGTTHKAQGGTYPAVFIDKTNIDKCRNPAVRARLMYVALTRARYNVYINQ